MTDRIKVVLFAVGAEPEVVQVLGFSGMKLLLGGLDVTIEQAPKWLRQDLPKRVTLYYDEDGRRKRLPLNRSVQLAHIGSAQPLLGAFIATAIQDGDNVSLTDDEVEQVLTWAKERTRRI